MKLPTAKQTAKLIELATQYADASTEHQRAYHAAKEQLAGDYKAAGKTPEVVAASAERDRIYPVMTAEMERLNKRFKGLGLINPAGFVGWGGGVQPFVDHLNRMIRDLAIQHWAGTIETEIKELRASLGDDVKPGQLNAGDFAFHNEGGVVKVSRVFTHKAKGVNLHTSEPVSIDRPHKRISQQTAERIVALAESKQTYLAERGLANVA